MRAIHIVAVALLALSLSRTVVANPSDDPHADIQQRIDAVLAPHIPTHEANGTVLVFQDGVEIYRREIGMADFEHGRKITRNTVFRLASLTKTFTGEAALSLRAENKLIFEAPISNYLPNFPRGHDIHVFQLLGHSSGLGDVPDPARGRRYASLDEAISSFAGQPLAFEPGTGSRYSNAGYVLSAKLIEIAAGQSYDEVLRTRFFAPLGMTSAINNPAPGSVTDAATLYFPAPTKLRVVPVEGSDLTSIVGAGSLLMNADDLMRWLEATRTSRFVDVWHAEYPFGWGKRTYFGGTAVEQSGKNAGFGASVTIVPGHNLSTLCLFNTQSGFALQCSTEVAAAVLGEPPPHASIALDLPRGKLDMAAARTMVGEYRAPQGWKLGFRLERGGLLYCFRADKPCERWIPVTPSTGGRYLLLGDSALVTVRASTGKQPQELAYKDSGSDIVLKRLPERQAN